MLAISHLSVLPSAHWNSVSALISDHFHGSIPCLHVPLSTLHVQPYDYPRMTRGQVGSLRLTCTTLSFATSRRFIPAHSNCVQNSGFYEEFWVGEARKLNCITGFMERAMGIEPTSEAWEARNKNLKTLELAAVSSL